MVRQLVLRALFRTASRIVPHKCRREWYGNWSAREILHERGELSDSGFAAVCRLCREVIKDAWSARMRDGTTQAFLAGPKFVLSAGAAMLILAAICTQGFRGVRTSWAAAPIDDPAGLVSIDYAGAPGERAAAFARLIPLWRAKSTQAEDIAGYRFAYRGTRAWVSWNFFSLLGTKPAAGRLPRAGDRDAVMLSYPAWRALYHGNPRIVGGRIRYGGQNYTVAGVLPETFWALSPVIEVWAPLDLEMAAESNVLVGAVGRRRARATPGQLAADLAEIARKTNAGPTRPVHVYSLANRLPGNGIDFYLIWTLFAAISCLALVAREHSGHGARRRSYWLFLGAKGLLAIVIPLSVWIEADAVFGTYRPLLGAVAGIPRVLAALVFLVVCVRALGWSFADQRRRCPVCLMRLAMAVSVGSTASVFEPALTELVCPNGHGALSLPADEADQRDRWTELDSSWEELFRR